MKRTFAVGRRAELRRGLTLMELVVVMVILAAVAGIVLPLLPNMITRAHSSTSATNLGEVGKAIQTYEAVYLSYPNGFDSLVTSAGTLPTYLPGNTGGDLTTLTTDTDVVGALRSAGITTVAQMVATGTGDFNPTFYPYGSDKSIVPTIGTIATGSTLAALTGTAARREFNLPLGGQYVVFGLGTRTSMQGKTLQEAPVHFSDDPTAAPNLAYSRVGIVFQTAGVNSSGTLEAFGRARMVGIVGFHDDGIASMNDHLGEYWAANKQ
jgi:prepilin-type N-terminal cleavage/methylation domain-containing protein